jgi:hypothetical protein
MIMIGAAGAVVGHVAPLGVVIAANIVAQGNSVEIRRWQGIVTLAERIIAKQQH